MRLYTQTPSCLPLNSPENAHFHVNTWYFGENFCNIFAGGTWVPFGYGLRLFLVSKRPHLRVSVELFAQRGGVWGRWLWAVGARLHGRVPSHRASEGTTRHPAERAASIPCPLWLMRPAIVVIVYLHCLVCIAARMKHNLARDILVSRYAVTLCRARCVTRAVSLPTPTRISG